MKKLIKFSLAIIAFLALTYYYIDSRPPKEIVTIYADNDDIKVKPENPGGEEFHHLDKKIYQILSNSENEKEEKLGPQPEKPLNYLTENTQDIWLESAPFYLIEIGPFPNLKDATKFSKELEVSFKLSAKQVKKDKSFFLNISHQNKEEATKICNKFKKINIPCKIKAE